MNKKMRYRLALDLGTTSLGWAMLRLSPDNQPYAVIKAGVRIFTDGRDTKGVPLAVTRRLARGMRRRRDRMLRRKASMTSCLLKHGFFPADAEERQALVDLNPYQLRAKGLDSALEPHEFARALFHINQRRGFKSNRKTDAKDSDSSVMKNAIKQLGERLKADNCRTVGEWLYKRQAQGETVRARRREQITPQANGRNKKESSYDLYIDRAMIEHEFDTLWATQARFNPALFNDTARDALKFILLFQRPLKPAVVGRCTLITEAQRAPLALPSTQRARIYQELNHLRILDSQLNEQVLSLEQRDILADELERNNKCTFTRMRKLLKLGSTVKFNLEDAKRTELKGNATHVILSKPELFGDRWAGFDDALQDEIVLKLVQDENAAELIGWLQQRFALDEARAERISQTGLPEGYGSLSQAALAKILPALRAQVITYDKAVLLAGFEHHSHLAFGRDGEVLPELPYYGEYLTRHVGFGTVNTQDPPEKRYGKIANPTVHIALNQVRKVVNELIADYGPPSEIIVEVARDLKQSEEQRRQDQKRQADNQKRNERLRAEAAHILEISPERVKRRDIEKMILWEELGSDAANRHCPYSGVQISAHMLLSDEVEIEHILPFSRTFDDSLNNKTVAMRQANRIKGNLTPWEAFGRQAVAGFEYASILARAEQMPKEKRYRFGEQGYEQWLQDSDGFLARALNDTRYMSRIAREYLALVCLNTRSIPGRMTAMLRAKFGLNDILGLHGEKNRDDHRHHAVDACVIGITDQGMLQRFATASAQAREQQLGRLVDNMPLPWENYRSHVKRAIERITVSHKPDHSHEGAMHNDTAYGLRDGGEVAHHIRTEDGRRELKREKLNVIEITGTPPHPRHGTLPDGSPKPYKGYKGDSNYCIEITLGAKGKWEGRVISTFEAYQCVRAGGLQKLRDPRRSLDGKPLVMRLMRNDIVRLNHQEETRLLRVAKISGDGKLALIDHQEANVDKRCRAKELAYVFKMPSTLQTSKARRVTVSPAGKIHYPRIQGVRDDRENR